MAYGHLVLGNCQAFAERRENLYNFVLHGR